MIVVKILTSFLNYSRMAVGESKSSRGIGFVYRGGSKPVIITCAHTVRGARSAFVKCGRQHIVEVLYVCDEHDVAILTCPRALENPGAIVRALSYRSRRIHTASLLTPWGRVRAHKKNGVYRSKHVRVGLSGSPLVEGGQLIGMLCGCEGTRMIMYHTLRELVRYRETL